MAIESTAINDLIAGLQNRPLQRDSQDWLFGERDDATEIDTSREDNATSPFDRSPPPVVSIPQPFMRPPGAALEYPLHRPSSPTSHVRITDWQGIAKKLALPIGLFSIVIVLLGVYVAKSDEAKADESKPAIKVVAATAASEPAPVVLPINEAAVEQPRVEEPQVVVHAEAQVVAEVEAPKVVEPEVEAPAAKVEAPVAAAAAPATAPVAEPVAVEPGSPASRFLATTAEPTIPTVAPKAAPAPQTVANLPPPPVAKPTAAIAPAPAKPIATAAAKPAKKSAAQVRADRRAAAKRAAKASIAATKARAKKQVAAADDSNDEEDEAPAKPVGKPAVKATGKGFLSISSTPAMDVWVDGRNSNAQTPVRIILLAGKHKVTLFDKQHSKAKSFEIEIKPDQTTKVVKNYQ